LHWIATVPATFMTVVATTYLAYDKIGFGLSLTVSTVIGISAALLSLVTFLVKFRSGAAVPEDVATESGTA